MDPWQKETLNLEVGDFVIWQDEAVEMEVGGYTSGTTPEAFPHLFLCRVPI